MSKRWLKDSLSMTFRVAAITLGGYALSSALSALAGMLCHVMGVPLADAMLTTVLLSYLFYTALLMWGFADRVSFVRPWTILGLAAVSMLLATLLAPGVLPS